MSGTIGSLNGLLPSGMYGVLANDSAGIKQKLNQLTQQSATGLVSNGYMLQAVLLGASLPPPVVRSLTAQ